MTAAALFQSAGPRVFTIPPASGFVDALARGLRAAFPDPAELSAATVLLPTRRAGRALADAFTRLEDGPGAALLPAIRPIGDVDADDPPFEPGELAEAAPEAISTARRRFELARLILARESASGRSMGVGGALALADDLARLLDDLATEQVDDLSALSDDIRAALPAHMAEAAMFLDIVLEAWPARLAELGHVDPARRRSLILSKLAERWTETPPEAPVIAAGSTGSIPAAATLLKVVAGLPGGAVVLPGFQADIDDRAWAAIDDAHPQRAMKSLIQAMGIDRKDVKIWPGAAEGEAEARRARVIAESLRPAEATSDWLARVEDLKEGWGADVFETALTGLSVIEAPEPAEEARAVALALRETLETPGARAVLVTPDRALARRVSVEMARFGVALDDSAGTPLSDTPAGGFLMRVLEVAQDPGSALGFAALANSPLFALGEDRARLKPEIGAMERRALRGRRPGTDFAAIAKRVREAAGEDEDRAARWTGIVEKTAFAFESFEGLKGDQPAAHFARALAETAEALAAEPDHPGADRLWAGEAGEAAASLVREFLTESEALPPLSLRDFARALLETARTRMVRPRYGAHPRLQILGPLEARLAGADRVILGGLNEGVWPAAPKADPFLSRGMRKAAGLSALEQRFGLSAHDFAQLASAPEVILTRAGKNDGAPTVASRWLWRLQTLARGALGDAEADLRLAPDTDYLALGRALDDPGARRNRVAAPEPAPPVDARPRQLSVTKIETWIRDPYAIFAGRILRLDPLDDLDRAPGGAERGQAYHAAIEQWTRSLPDTDELPLGALDRLIDFGRAALLDAGFPEARLGLELPRFVRAARYLVDWESGRRRLGFRPVVIEASGQMEVDGPAGPFLLTARVDRVDMRPDGALDIIDYKTGGVPSKKEVGAGFAPQLPLQAAMAARGGFEGCPSHEPGDLVYIQITGGKTPGKECSVVKDPGTDEVVDLAEDARDDLAAWIAKFDDERRTYPSQPRAKYTNRWGDFDHLARRKEWASAAEDGGEGGGE
ncbi:MAG: double-strand break repair protein AddB [Oceanicaulis sp.]